MSRGFIVAAGVIVLLATCGCTTSRQLSSRGELAQVAADRPITVYAQDDRVYRLSRHTLADSVIQGSGTLSQRGDTAPFEGAIPLAQVIAVETSSRNVMKGLAIMGITALFVAYAVEAGNASGGLTSTEDVAYIGPSGGTGSCPYLYAWDGRGYALQAEPFGVAWGRALELSTVHLLPVVREDHGLVRLRLANEREETHHVNTIRLSAIQLGAAAGAVLDDEGRAWPLTRPVAPASARDDSGHSILTQVGSADGRMWECDASSLTPGSGFTDVIEVTFARPRHASTGSLVVTGINTALWTAVYSQLCRVVAHRTAELAHAIETDPELIAELRAYLHEASLEAFVWNGRGWESAGVIQPEASAVSFARSLRIRIPDRAGDSVRVRLRSMADVWRIDAISAEWGDAQPLPMTPLRMLSAIGPAGEDLRDDIRADDGRYAIMLPPDRVDLTFAAARPAAGSRVAYAVAGRGYLHEWEPRRMAGGISSFASQVPEEGRIEFLKEMLKHRQLALAPMYEAWRTIRAR